MNQDILPIAAVILILFSTSTLLLTKNWRFCIAALSIQYVAVFFLVLQNWPLEMAIVKLVTGWIAGGLIGLMFRTTGVDEIAGEIWPAGRLLRIMIILLIIVTIWSLVPSFTVWVPGSSTLLLAGGLLLISSGLLQISFVTQPLQVVLGLLTFLSGFEVIYSTVERSVLIAGLLSGVNLILALIGAYLIAIPEVEEEV